MDEPPGVAPIDPLLDDPLPDRPLEEPDPPVSALVELDDPDDEPPVRALEPEPVPPVTALPDSEPPEREPPVVEDEPEPVDVDPVEGLDPDAPADPPVDAV